MVAAREAPSLAERLLADTIAAQQVEAGQLTLHADRGTSMTSKPVAMLLADLGVTKIATAVRTSRNDNPYSEAQFKTLKYRPDLPGAVRLHRRTPERSARPSSAGTTHEHRHAGIGLLTPADVHYGRAEAVTSARAVVLDAAYAGHPERFVGKPPQPPRLPQAVWINKPIDPSEAPQQFPD